MVPKPGALCSPVANGKVQPVIAGEVHGGDDVSHLLGAEHRQRALVKHAVVNGARLVVALVAGGEQPARTLSRNDATLIPSVRLPEREIQILRLVADGRTNTAIAHALEVSPRTVTKHL